VVPGEARPLKIAPEAIYTSSLEQISQSLPSPANYMYKLFGAEEFRQLNAKHNIQPDFHRAHVGRMGFGQILEEKARI